MTFLRLAFLRTRRISSRKLSYPFIHKSSHRLIFVVANLRLQFLVRESSSVSILIRPQIFVRKASFISIRGRNRTRSRGRSRSARYVRAQIVRAAKSCACYLLTTGIGQRLGQPGRIDDQVSKATPRKF